MLMMSVLRESLPLWRGQLHALDQDGTEQHGQIGGRHRARNGDQYGHQLGQKGQGHRRRCRRTTATRHAATPDCSTNGALDGAVPVGIVPARPHKQVAHATADVATAPWTERRSVARCWRHETRWVETAWPRVPVVPISMTNRKAGRRDQKAGPKLRSSPWPGVQGKNQSRLRPGSAPGRTGQTARPLRSRARSQSAAPTHAPRPRLAAGAPRPWQR